MNALNFKEELEADFMAEVRLCEEKEKACKDLDGLIEDLGLNEEKDEEMKKEETKKMKTEKKEMKKKKEKMTMKKRRREEDDDEGEEGAA